MTSIDNSVVVSNKKILVFVDAFSSENEIVSKSSLFIICNQNTLQYLGNWVGYVSVSLLLMTNYAYADMVMSDAKKIKL